jgi:hypothetical protein
MHDPAAQTGRLAGDAGMLILQKFPVKEELRSLLRLAGTNPERHARRGQLSSLQPSL